MKKLIILAMILALVGIATIALAGPGGPWVYYDADGDGLTPDYCDHPSPGELDGYWYVNTNTGKVHCFKAD